MTGLPVSGNESRQLAMPRQGFSPPAPSPFRVLLVCFYDPRGIPTVIETVAFLQAASRNSVTVLNLFEHRLDEGSLKLHPWLDLDAFDAVVIHNTVSYNVDNLRRLDDALPRRLRDWRGVKVLLKQDENYRFREVARWIGETGIDVLFTTLPPEAVPLLYPAEVVGRPYVERMLTGYVTPALRQPAPQGPRPVDIGYRGSIQSLSFGRLAFEKRSIGEDVAARLAGRGLSLDISSRWEDRLGGQAWLRFLSSCKATLGVESGASIFDLAGNLEQRVAALERQHTGEPNERRRCEAVLQGLADLEGNVQYHQVSPRHFEAAACGTLQLLFPGGYSGVLAPWRHFVPLERDFSNLEEALAVVLDDERRSAFTQAARQDVVERPDWWIEGFVARVDAAIDQVRLARGSAGGERRFAAARHVLVFGVACVAAPDGFQVHELAVQADAQGEGWLHRLAPPEDAGAARALAEVLWAQELLRLPESGFCEALGAPPGHAAHAAFRTDLHRWLREVSALLDAAGRAEGPHVLWACSPASLAAALLSRARWNVPVLYRPGEPARAMLESHAQFWSGLERRLAAQATEVLPSGADDALAREAISRVAAGAACSTFAVHPARPPHLAPGRVSALDRPAEIPRRAAYAMARTAWRVLPLSLQERVKPLARRWMARLF